eukprot:34935_1
MSNNTNINNDKNQQQEMKLVEGYTRKCLLNSTQFNHFIIDLLLIVCNYVKEVLEINLYNSQIGCVENNKIIKASNCSQYLDNFRYMYFTSATPLSNGFHDIKIKILNLDFFNNETTLIGITTLNNKIDYHQITDEEINILDMDVGSTYYYKSKVFGVQNGHGFTAKRINRYHRRIQSELLGLKTGDIISMYVDFRDIHMRELTFAIQRGNDAEIQVYETIDIVTPVDTVKYYFFLQIRSWRSRYELISHTFRYT